MGIAGDIALILVASLFCAMMAQRLGLPLLLGYIVAGIMVGPNTFGPTVVDAHEIELLADIGVALLLFTVGLEFPLEKLKPVAGIALVGAPIQIFLVSGYGFLLGSAMGWETHEGIWFGALISISSTMVVLKVLMARGLMDTLSSKVMLAILVVQDLAVIPMMLVLPALSNLEEGMASLGTALLRATIFILFMALVGSRLLPWLLARAAQWQSRELFIVVVLGLGLGVGYATYLVGLSFAFGAFLAGLVLSRSEHSHDALSDMTPLRELFSLLFFAGVGMLISPDFLWANLSKILLLALLVMFGKGVLMAGVTRAFGYTRIIPLAVALSMAQVGEFSLVLARVGKDGGALNEEIYFTLVSVAVITMAFTPFSAQPTYRLYQWWLKLRGIEPEVRVCQVETEDRIVVVGYNEIAIFVCKQIQEREHDPLILDQDFDRVQRARDAGFDAHCVDVRSKDAFDTLKLSRARILLVTRRDRFLCTKILDYLKENAVPVVAVASSDKHVKELHDLGIREAILAPMEVGLELIHQVLLAVKYDEYEAHTIVAGIRQNHYLGDAAGPGQDLKGLRMEWIAESKLEGTLAQLNLRRQTGASIVAVVRGEELMADTGPNFELKPGDRIAVVGSPRQRGKFRKLVLETVEEQSS